MPKKPPPNGYYFFMLQFKRDEENQGRRFHGGMQEVAVAASDSWKALPQAQKEWYNQLAKEKKNDPRPNVPKADEKRFNSQGVSFAQIKREKARAEEKLKRESNFITQFVNDMTLDDLHHKLIYLIHVNIFCKTDADVYYPAEIGIVKFSLEDGVKDVFHRFIDPGEITTGYSYAVKEHSELTHKLSLSFVKSIPGTSDLQRLYEDICKFLTEDEDERAEECLPPMFSMYDDVINNTSLTAARKTMKNLWETMFTSDETEDDFWESHFKILPLPDMFQKLKNKCAIIDNPNVTAFPNAVLPKMELLKDTYHYDVRTACKFHREEDIIVHCSQAFVLRWAFIIRDHCTDLIGVELFKENFVPKPMGKNQYCGYDDDDTASLAESLQSVQISEASIDFSQASSRVKRSGGGASESLRLRRDEDDYGSVKYGKDSASTSHSYASSASTSRRKDAGESQFASVDKDDNFDSYSTVSLKKGADTDPDSDAQQSVKSCPVAWPSVNRPAPPQNVLPVMNENNFPSLGRGRGRGSLRNLRGK